MEIRPNARGPSTGAWTANNTSANNWENTVLVVSHDVGDNLPRNFK